jgi:hypothetical protein
MGVKGFARVGLSALAGLALTALTASAQQVTYSTSGAFSGAICSATSCSAGGFTLSFANAPSTSYLAPTLVDLGQFVTTASGASQPLTAFTGASFTLTINQTAPSNGNTSFVGTISGSLAFNPSTSSLVWTPTTSTGTIGFAQYRLVTDNTGNINIQAPTTGDNSNPNNTSVKADVSVTPEPATALLLAPAIAGMGFFVRRRRNT